MKELFKQQLEENKRVTEEYLGEMQNKTYHNGEQVKVGDQPLFAMNVEPLKDSVKLNLIMLSEEHFDEYEINDEYKERFNSLVIPVISVKK